MHKALGRDVEKIESARRELPLDLILRAAILRRVEKSGFDAEIVQCVDLILHQRDERRNDDAGAPPDESRDLVAQRFAAAGRHQSQAIAAVEDGGNDIALQRPETLVAEDRFKLRTRRVESSLGRGLKPEGKWRGESRHRWNLCA